MDIFWKAYYSEQLLYTAAYFRKYLQCHFYAFSLCTPCYVFDNSLRVHMISFFYDK